MGDTRAGSSYTLPCPLPHSNRPTLMSQPVSESRRCCRQAAHLTCPSLSQCWVGPSRGSNPGPGGGRHGRGWLGGSGAVGAVKVRGHEQKLIYIYTNICRVRYPVSVCYALAVQWYSKRKVCRRSWVRILFATFLNPGIAGLY